MKNIASMVTVNCIYYVQAICLADFLAIETISCVYSFLLYVSHVNCFQYIAKKILWFCHFLPVNKILTPFFIPPEKTISPSGGDCRKYSTYDFPSVKFELKRCNHFCLKKKEKLRYTRFIAIRGMCVKKRPSDG